MLSSLTHWVQTTIADHGLTAVFVLMLLESACIPVPSELTMIYAGYLVSQGTFSFVAAVLVGAFANLVGSWIAWAAGAYGVDAVLVRGDHAKEELARTQRYFDRYGANANAWVFTFNMFTFPLSNGSLFDHAQEIE